MILSGIGRRYAVALFNAALNGELADQVQGDVTSFARLYADNARFRRFLESPSVPTEAKKELILQSVGDRASGLFVKFLLLLIDKKRLSSIPAVADAYTALFEEREGILEVKVVTAVPLARDLETQTREVIERQTGKRARLHKIVDPGIIGGMILFARNRIVDGSVKHRLETMTRQLREVRVH
jgi:F-type H+-transporting ATPase subunit delta